MWKLRRILEDVHDASCIIVDANEMNFLVDTKTHSNVYAIDVDSYQTPSYPATVIMQNIRDYSSNSFDEKTDFFAFAILTFQLWIGIHPYRGTHKKIRNLEDRMKNNISVFDSEVIIPSICPPFDVIPKNLRKWYQDVFQGGVRTLPPSDFDSPGMTPMVTRKVASVQSQYFETKIMFQFKGEVIRKHFYYNGNNFISTDKFTYINQTKIDRSELKSGWLIFANDVANTPYIAKLHNRHLSFINAYTGEVGSKDVYGLTSGINNIDKLMAFKNRLYAKIEDQIFEIEINRMLKNNMVSSCMPNATEFYGGFAIQIMLASVFVYVFPERGKVYNFKIDELKNYKVVNGRMIENVCVIIGINKDGQYDRLVIKFDFAGNRFSIRKTENIQIDDINIACTSAGVCAHIIDDGLMEIFHSKYDSNQVMEIQDSFIRSDMELSSCGQIITYSSGDALYSIKRK
jgi:hypothetical protein